MRSCRGFAAGVGAGGFAIEGMVGVELGVILILWDDGIGGSLGFSKITSDSPNAVVVVDIMDMASEGAVIERRLEAFRELLAVSS